MRNDAHSRATRRWRALPALLAGAFAVVATAQSLMPSGGTATPPPAQAAQPVPDPADLAANWWDYLGQSGENLEQRIALLVGQAGVSASRLPPEEAAAAAPLLDRLRIALAALPGISTATAVVPDPLPDAAASYTPRQVMQIDRDRRELEFDLDERRSALNAAARALKDERRRFDTEFATYLSGRGTGAARTLLGLQLIANRAEIAVAEAEQKLREAENRMLSERLRAVFALRDRAAGRLVPDPERSAAKLTELIGRNGQKLDAQREQLLRARAERSRLAADPGATRARIELEDLRITAATIAESLLTTRISLYETELDWLSASRDDLEPAEIMGMEERLASRRQQMATIEEDAGDRVAVIQRVIANSLRKTGNELSPDEARDRAASLQLAQTTITDLTRLRSLVGDLRYGTVVTSSLLAGAGGWRGWIQGKVVEPAANLVENADRWLGASLFRIGETPVTAYGLLRVVIFLLLAVLLSRLARHLLARFGAHETGRPSAALYTVGRLLHYVLIAAAVIVGLASIGLDFSQLALVAGALSIGIGFGLQSIVNNFVSGLMILFEQNLKVGDIVELDSGVRGAVKEINVRSTLVVTSDGVDVVVPNAEFVSGKVINFTLEEPYHRIHVPFGVAYGSEKEEVRRVVLEAARAVPFTHERPGREPDVWLVKFGDNSLDFELVVWINPTAVKRAGAVTAAYLWEIEGALRRHGIQIPFPQRDVRLTIAPDDAQSSSILSPGPGHSASIP
jgi:small-conductance mechanosensitive channel